MYNLNKVLGLKCKSTIQVNNDRRHYFQPYEWGLSNTLTTNHVWDGFVILSLLDDAVFRGHLLVVPHSGAQSDRFKAAMEERSQWIVLHGQPDAVRHACDLCMRIFLMPDGTFRTHTCLSLNVNICSK
jgi:hypothetical protein